MQPGQHPDAIDTQLVLRVYAWITIAGGLFTYAWPPMVLQTPLGLSGVPFSDLALLRVAATVVTASGFCAAGFSAIDDPMSRRRALYWFAFAHILFGGMFLGQWFAILSVVLPPIVGWAPLVAGIVLLYLAVTYPASPRFRRAFVSLFDADAAADGTYSVGTKPEGLNRLRSQFEEQIRQAARQEERARLARDLHDAVKQQLFVIQTAAATAEARFETDAQGAKAALEQVRTATREAMTEMEAMIEQLQATPLENAGLVEALKKQCEALGYRTGADVKLEVGALPPSEALPPGAQQALFRCAQEALANIGRHARARHVTVTLERSRDRLKLTIRDDGVGFDPDQAREGMGLRNMSTRTGVLAGTFTLSSKPGGGTAVGFSIPFDTTSPQDYRTKALVWTLVLVAMMVNLVFGDAWEGPWSAAVAAIAAITVARNAVAYVRVRRASSVPA